MSILIGESCLEELFGFLEPGLRDTLLHVLSCPPCRELMTGALLGRPTPARPGHATERQRDLAARLATVFSGLEEERAAAEGLLGELLSCPPARRLRKIRSRRFQKLGLVSLLLTRSRQAQFDDPQAADDLARLAAQLASDFISSSIPA